MKSVDISEASISQLQTVLKGFFDNLVEGVSNAVLDKLDLNKEVSLKSIEGQKVEEVIVNPVLLKGYNSNSDVTLKSVETPSDEGNEEVVLKSIATEYLAVKGATQSHAQRRASLLLKAEELGYNKNQFMQIVKQVAK